MKEAKIRRFIAALSVFFVLAGTVGLAHAEKMQKHKTPEIEQPAKDPFALTLPPKDPLWNEWNDDNTPTGPSMPIVSPVYSIKIGETDSGGFTDFSTSRGSLENLIETANAGDKLTVVAKTASTSLSFDCDEIIASNRIFECKNNLNGKTRYDFGLIGDEDYTYLMIRGEDISSMVNMSDPMDIESSIEDYYITHEQLNFDSISVYHREDISEEDEDPFYSIEVGDILEDDRGIL